MDDRRQILTGMKEITAYAGMGEDCILKLIQKARFPARKTDGTSGIWISSREAIDKWSTSFANSGIQQAKNSGGIITRQDSGAGGNR